MKCTTIVKLIFFHQLKHPLSSSARFVHVMCRVSTVYSSAGHFHGFTRADLVIFGVGGRDPDLSEASELSHQQGARARVQGAAALAPHARCPR